MSGSILVAIDLAMPREARMLLNRAGQLAELDRARLSAVSVIPRPGEALTGAPPDPGGGHDALALATERLRALTREALGPGAELEQVIRHGNIHAEILAAAEEVTADLIVIGAHRHDVRDFLLGSNAERVVRHAKASVLVMRA